MKLHILALLLPLTLLAQTTVPNDPPATPLYPDKPLVSPDTEEFLNPKNNPDDSGRNRRFKDVVNPTITLYTPEKQDAKRTAIVICPGGGYSTVVIDREGHNYARFLRKAGVTALVLKYRIPTGEPLPENTLSVSQQDALAAIRYLRENAAKLNIDPNRIGIIGSSAGGHLAISTAMLTNPGDSSRPSFVAALYPVVKMDNTSDTHKGSRDKLLGSSPTAAQTEKYSLQTQARPGLPPFFLIHSTNDSAVPVGNSIDLTTALIRNKVPVFLNILPSGGHGFCTGRANDPLTQLWPAQLITWLSTLP